MSATDNSKPYASAMEKLLDELVKRSVSVEALAKEFGIRPETLAVSMMALAIQTLERCEKKSAEKAAA